MEFESILADRRQRLLARWQARMFEIYPADSARFYAGERNAFANPVGCTSASQSEALFQHILDGGDRTAIAAALEPIIRIRAVQELAPSVALGFVPLLKAAIREELGPTVLDAATARALATIDARIDDALLVAVDLYVRCREEVARIRVREATRGVSGALRRLGVSAD